ncbi:MAG: oxygen-dependent coproporphyrinogen oxidase [Saprospiraceae bacterium]|nr:oxygen-dependent coproporphyrinogen oxidase [Saprospiraceae bacterium]
MGLDRDQIVEHFKTLQDTICSSLERLDQRGRFHEDSWSMETGGGGRTRLIEGQHIEKGGVNFSAVQGPISQRLSQILGKVGEQFFATGVSIVLHPTNPWVPIIHMNVRFFEVDDDTWWFGGGIDLTPHYVNTAEAREFHRALQVVCNRVDVGYYKRFSEDADQYFFLKHREERRGIGGIFFDRLSTGYEGKSKEALFDFVMDVGNSFIPLYSTLFHANYLRAFDAKEKEWQLYRRGRYVEFNLVWDRGTRFGLETGGRTESILMSLPSVASWRYDFTPIGGSLEAQTQSYLKQKVDWLSFTN